MTNIEKRKKATTIIADMMYDCVQDMLNVGIPVQADNILDIRLMPLHDTQAGCFYRTSSNGEMEFILAIHDDFVRYMDDTVVLENVKNSIYHELLHTCPNAQEHNQTWLQLAVQCDELISSKTRVYQEREIYYNVSNDVAYIYRCDDCGFEYHSVSDEFEHMQCDICQKQMH